MILNQLKTILLLGALSALIVGVGAALAPGYIAVFAVLALAMNVGSYYFSDRIVLAMNRAREVPPEEGRELHAMVEELARSAGIPKPRVYLIEDYQPNAFATGRNPKHGVVAVTAGILQLLDKRELRGVLAHELAHIKNRDILVASVAAAGASLISFIANAISFAAIFGGGQQSDEEEGSSPFGGLVFAFLAPIAASLVQLAISRSREYMADEAGARIAGDAQGLADALRKLHLGVQAVPAATQPATASLFIANPLAGVGGLMSWFSTHPPMEERIKRLEALARADRDQARGQGSSRLSWANAR
jgi:heat shock protein HtpX